MFLKYLFTLISCASSLNVHQTASIVVSREVALDCRKNIDNCDTIAITTSGTATRINWKGKHYWLTAGHVCAASESMGMTSLMKNITFTVAGTNEIEISKIMTYSMKEDLCITDAKQGSARQIARNEPRLSSDVTIIAYPKGVFDYKMLPIYDGRWSGQLKEKCVITIPVAGGSSGAGVINDKGQLVGVVEAVVKDFNHLTVISCTKNIRAFLEKATVQLNSAEVLKTQTQELQY